MAGKSGSNKHGRDSRRPTHQRYNANNQHDKNKAKRIFKSNGEAGLKDWNAGNGGKMRRTKRNPSAKHNSLPQGERS